MSKAIAITITTGAVIDGPTRTQLDPGHIATLLDKKVDDILISFQTGLQHRRNGAADMPKTALVQIDGPIGDAHKSRLLAEYVNDFLKKRGNMRVAWVFAESHIRVQSL